MQRFRATLNVLFYVGLGVLAIAAGAATELLLEAYRWEVILWWLGR